MVTLYKSPQTPLRNQNLKNPSNAQGPPTMLKRTSPVTEIKSYFTGEKASTRSGSHSWGWLSLR
jgi:hypothetical protein